MAEEKELLTILAKDEYEQVLTRFKNEFGEPKVQKRLSLQSDDYGQSDIDTRIRITNGKAELMQKVGDWKKREVQIKKMKINAARMYGELQGVVGNALPDIKTFSLPQGKKNN